VRRLIDRPDRHGIRSHRLRDERQREDGDRHHHEDQRELHHACGEDPADGAGERLVDSGRHGRGARRGWVRGRRPDRRSKSGDGVGPKLRGEDEDELGRERLVMCKVGGNVHVGTPRDFSSASCHLFRLIGSIVA
jgi:hypothetical protein